MLFDLFIVGVVVFGVIVVAIWVESERRDRRNGHG